MPIVGAIRSISPSLVEFLQVTCYQRYSSISAQVSRSLIVQLRLEFLANCTTWIPDCIDLYYLWILLVTAVELRTPTTVHYSLQIVKCSPVRMTAVASANCTLVVRLPCR